MVRLLWKHPCQTMYYISLNIVPPGIFFWVKMSSWPIDITGDCVRANPGAFTIISFLKLLQPSFFKRKLRFGEFYDPPEIAQQRSHRAMV